MAQGRTRARPNILITGTPETGKTTIARALDEATGLRCINTGDLVRDKKLHNGWDDKFDCCHRRREDVPKQWFDRVVVLQTETSVLYDRLSNRGYSGSKLSNNMECEIFQILLEEATDCYPDEVVSAQQNNTVEEIGGDHPCRGRSSSIESYATPFSSSATTTCSPNELDAVLTSFTSSPIDVWFTIPERGGYVTWG